MADEKFSAVFALTQQQAIQQWFWAHPLATGLITGIMLMAAFGLIRVWMYIGRQSHG